jgi:hypothetical protein
MSVIERNLLASGPLRKYTGGSTSQSGESSVTYDYSGLEDHIKRQDAVDALRGSKFTALYSGDIPASIEAGSKIRNLVSGLRRAAPGTTERNPQQVSMPHVVAKNISSSSSMRSDSPGFEFGPEEPDEFLESMSGDPAKRKPTKPV